MNVIRFLRNLVVFVASVYLFQHVYKICPLNAPLDYSNTLDVNYDPICVYSHKSYDLISPYVASAVDAYESSSIKPIIDGHLETVKPGFVYVSTQLDKLSDYVAAYREAHEQNVIQTLESSSKTVSDFITTVIDFFNTTILPVVSECTKIVYNKLNIYTRGIKIFIYLKWNIYVKPYILRSLEKFFTTKVGLYLIKLENTKQFTVFVNALSCIYESIVKAYNFIREQIDYIYNINVESKKTEAYELIKAKQAFLHDLAQYLPDSFNFKSQKTSSDLSSSVTTSVSVSFSSSINVSVSTTTTTTVAAPTATSTSEKYEALLKTTTESANEDFVSEVNELAAQYKSKLHSSFQPLMKELAANVNGGYEKIHDQLNRINEFKDNEHPSYVSRQDYRDALAEKKASIDQQVEAIETKLNEEVEAYLDQVLKIRVGIIETLEEFADSTLNAYSASIIANGDDWQEWKKYKELKKSLINFRDELIDKKPADDLSVFLNKLKRDAYILTNEAGSYMAILRAKANLEFQSREKEEREAKARLEEAQRAASAGEEIYEEYDDEEPETETITETRYVTQTRTASASEIAQGEQPVEEEASESINEETETEEVAEPEVEDVEIVEQEVEPVIKEDEPVAEETEAEVADAESVAEEIAAEVESESESDSESETLYTESEIQTESDSSTESIEYDDVIPGSDEVKVVIEPEADDE